MAKLYFRTIIPMTYQHSSLSLVCQNTLGNILFKPQTRQLHQHKVMWNSDSFWTLTGYQSSHWQWSQGRDLGFSPLRGSWSFCFILEFIQIHSTWQPERYLYLVMVLNLLVKRLLWGQHQINSTLKSRSRLS